MNISSLIGSSLSQALQDASGVASASDATNSSALSGTVSASSSDATSISSPAKLLSELQDLQKSDPTKFKEVMKAVADSLTKAANATTDAGEKQALTDVASGFEKASQTGNLADIAPAGGPPPGGGPAGAGGAGGASGSSSTKTYDAADTNKDGKVSMQEKLAYAAKLAHSASGAAAKYASSASESAGVRIGDTIGQAVASALAQVLGAGSAKSA